MYVKRVLVFTIFKIVEERSRYRPTKGFYRGCHVEHAKGIMFPYLFLGGRHANKQNPVSEATPCP